MTGFADNLIARAAGAPAGSLQPRIPAAFESWPGPPHVVEEAGKAEAPSPARISPAVAPVDSAVTPRIAGSAPDSLTPTGADVMMQPLLRVETREIIREREFHNTLTRETRFTEPKTLIAPVETPASAKQPALSPGPAERIVVEPRTIVQREREIHELPRDSPSRLQISPVFIPPPAVQPRAAIVAHPAVWQAPLKPSVRTELPRGFAVEPPVPDVHINIGRIEIRATNPQSAPARRQRRESMTLEEYGRQRRGEAR